MSTVQTIKMDEEMLLRWPSMVDAEELFKLIDANREHLGRWLPWVDVIGSVEDVGHWNRGSFGEQGGRKRDFASNPLPWRDCWSRWHGDEFRLNEQSM